jgi:nitroreductase
MSAKLVAGEPRQAETPATAPPNRSRKSASQDKPSVFPREQVTGAPLKPITQVLLDRRATARFKRDPVPDEYLRAILTFAAQAPSGYNLQPWRFIVVRDQANRERLKKAAMDQPKVAEAPVVVIAFAVKGEWKKRMDTIFQESVRRGNGQADQTEKNEKTASDFLESIPPAVWLNRHTMIAVTTMMLVAEAYGLDTAPMEGFNADAIIREFGLPEGAEVVALLAIGFAREPEKAYPGRLPLSEIVHMERYRADPPQ